MNVKNHKAHDYVRQQNGSIRAQNEGPLIASVNQMLGEYNSDFLEIVRRKKRVKDKTAGNFRYTVYRVPLIVFINVNFSSLLLCYFAKRKAQNVANR